MKIMMVFPVMDAGGAQAVLAALARDAVAQGDLVQVASSGGFHARALAAEGVGEVPLRLVGRRPHELLSSVLRLRRAAGRTLPDLVHAHNVKAAVVARLALGRTAPILVTLHGVPEAEYPWASRLLRWCADEVAAVSPYVVERLTGLGFPVERLHLVENSISPPEPHDRTAARDRLGIPRAARVAVCVARLAPQKRHDLLVRAWSGLAPDTLLLIAGSGPTLEVVQEEVRRHDLGGRVRMLGERRDVEWLLAAADLLVLPTDWEGMPISMLEAMSAGVPVVASRVDGVVETLGEGVRLVQPDSVPALADALGTLLGDAEARAGLARRGRELVEQRYPPGSMLKAYRQLYDDLARQTKERVR